ncbi:hypothetical protein KCU95_g6143, partial [Aureobasidium melanogenum]
MSGPPASVIADSKNTNPVVWALIYEPLNHSWRLVETRIIDLLEDDKVSTCVIFSSIQHFLDDNPLRKELCKHFPNIPRMFWSRTCVQHNGFFGAKTSTDFPSRASVSSGTTIIDVQTWFRMIVVKTVNSPPRSGRGYRWFEMSFLSSYTKRRNLLLCFDTPKYISRNMLNVLVEEEHSDAATGPYGLHQLLLEQLMGFYDAGVWSIARTIRDSNRHSENDKGTELFLKLDENARHSTHSIEATQEAARVVACIAQHCETLALRSSVHQELLISRCEIFKFHHTLMQGFLARAFANDRRVGHSKDLTLNVSSGLDRRFNQMIAALAREDSASMKAIAYVTMTFLPATFVSALLGMNFFNFSPDEHQGHITYSHDLWIYFVISIVFTLIMFVLYWIWQQFRKKARARSNIEDEDAAENAYSTVEKEHMEKTRPRGSYLKGSRMIST